MLNIKLPNGKILSVSTSRQDQDVSYERKNVETSKNQYEKSNIVVNIYGGNNSIAPSADKAEQNIQKTPK